MTQVHISSNTHTVTVNHDGADLTYVVEKAQKLWDDTRPPDRTPGPAVGFSSTLTAQWNHDRQSGQLARPVRAEADIKESMHGCASE